jgi:SPP1 family predicted phage head-tail adaptor
VNPAKLRHLVAIQSRATTPNAHGQLDDTWTTILTAFADVEPVSGQSQESAGAELATVTHTITIRFRSNITTRNRLVYGQRIFDIVSVIDVEERHFWLQLGCVEGQNKG